MTTLISFIVVSDTCGSKI